jgi:putative nucleotidyltransferase-like protein
MPEPMTPEDQLCLLLARGQLMPDLRKRILESLARPLQWPVVLERAYDHEVYPLLYRNLRELGFPGVPDAVQAELKRAFLANAIRNKLLAEELARLLGLLGKAGIPVIPLKGITLAESLYGDAASRVCADIDILVPPDKVAQALNLILAIGYRDDFRDPFFSKLAWRYGRHYHLAREDQGVSLLLELHWKLVQHSSKNDEAIKDLWAEARPKTSFGATALALSPEWELLYLALHAADHQWELLKWISDIHEIQQLGLIDWQKLKNKAEQFELDSVVRQTLTLCALLLGTSMPKGLSPADLRTKIPFPAGAPQAAFSHLHVLTRPLDKLRCMATVVLVPKATDQQFLRLPSSLSFLYYPMRPMRLTLKWSWRLLRAAFARATSTRGSLGARV